MNYMNLNAKFLIVTIITIGIAIVVWIGLTVNSTFKNFAEINSIRYQLNRISTMTLNDIKWNTIEKNLKDNERKLFHFWSTYCKSCIAEFDSIQKYQSNFKGKIYLVSLEDSTTVKRFLASKQWDLNFYTTDSTMLPFTPKTIKFYPTNFVVQNNSIEDSGAGPLEWKVIE